MSVMGTGAVAIWHDIAAEGRDEFYAWHGQEHMPERVGIKGFIRGRRWIAIEVPRDDRRSVALGKMRADGLAVQIGVEPTGRPVTVDLGQPALSDYAALSTPPTIAAIVVPAGDTPADFGVLEPAEVVGHVFVDGAGGEAADRAWDPEDPVLSGVVVTFADEDAIYATVTATSDVDGVYAALLPPGTWTVGVQQLPGGYAGPFFAPGAGALTLLPGDYAERDIAFESTGGSL